MRIILDWFWSIMSYIGYPVFVLKYTPWHGGWNNGRPYYCKRATIGAIKCCFGTKRWVFHDSYDPLGLWGTRLETYHSNIDNKNIFAPVKGDVVLFSSPNEYEYEEKAIVFNGRRWKRLAPPLSVTAFRIDKYGRGRVKIGENITLEIYHKGEPGLTIGVFLDYLGGLIDTSTLLLIHEQGIETKRRLRDRELLQSALETIRKSKSYCKSRGLAEAAAAIEQVLQR